MAAQLALRRIPSILTRIASVQAPAAQGKAYSGHPPVAGIEERIKDPLEHATGLERQELALRLQGNENPYFCYGFHKRQDLNEVPIPHNEGKRMVACLCEEDSQGLSWMWVYRGPGSRCKCGYWFKLVDARPI